MPGMKIFDHTISHSDSMPLYIYAPNLQLIYYKKTYYNSGNQNKRTIVINMVILIHIFTPGILFYSVTHSSNNMIAVCLFVVVFSFFISEPHFNNIRSSSGWLFLHDELTNMVIV